MFSLSFAVLRHLDLNYILVEYEVGDITVEWLILVRFVNNAGIAIEGENPSKEDPFHVGVHATPISTWDKTQRINARGTFLGCKYAITQMLKQEVGPSGSRGWIINMASVAGLVGIPGAGMSSLFYIYFYGR